MCIVRGSVVLADTTFAYATAEDGGGGIFADLTVLQTARVAMHNCTIQDCATLANGGGALLVTGSSNAALVHCNITDCNTSGGGAIAGHGTAV